MAKRLVNKLLSGHDPEIKNVTVGFRLPSNVRDDLDTLSTLTGKNKSEIVREILADILPEALEQLESMENKKEVA